MRLATGIMTACAGRAGIFSAMSLTSAVVLGTGETWPLPAAGAPLAAAASAENGAD